MSDNKKWIVFAAASHYISANRTNGAVSKVAAHTHTHTHLFYSFFPQPENVFCNFNYHNWIIFLCFFPIFRLSLHFCARHFVHMNDNVLTQPHTQDGKYSYVLQKHANWRKINEERMKFEAKRNSLFCQMQKSRSRQFQSSLNSLPVTQEKGERKSFCDYIWCRRSTKSEVNSFCGCRKW